MSYPKPLSTKSIEKLFASWNPHTVEVLHTYYEAFANLYGSIQLKNAWQIFKKFQPKIRKQQFMDFASIVRREDVPYYIFEVNEIYSEEKPSDTERYIVNKDVIHSGYGKFRFLYDLDEAQYGKPFYALPDLLEAAAHRLYDQELRVFINNMIFSDGEHAGKRFSEVIIITKSEQFDIDYYSKNKAKTKQLYDKANISVAEKLMKKIVWWLEFARQPIFSPIARFLNEIGYVFESEEQAQQFFKLLQDFANNSHLWKNCGFTPNQMHSVMAGQSKQSPPSIILGSGIQKAIQNGEIDIEELTKQLKEKGFDVVG